MRGSDGLTDLNDSRWPDRPDPLVEVGPVSFSTSCGFGVCGPTGPTFFNSCKEEEG